ncbi:hypothetical protein [Streptacidiphilus sp. EB103A]|uniref:hypothetical protein n=1 Tax=Streptacidiphilus sp. EB103A TaxID=3156275 RepID=UPI003515B408
MTVNDVDVQRLHGPCAIPGCDCMELRGAYLLERARAGTLASVEFEVEDIDVLEGFIGFGGVNRDACAWVLRVEHWVVLGALNTQDGARYLEDLTYRSRGSELYRHVGALLDQGARGGGGLAVEAVRVLVCGCGVRFESRTACGEVHSYWRPHREHPRCDDCVGDDAASAGRALAGVFFHRDERCGYWNVVVRHLPPHDGEDEDTCFDPECIDVDGAELDVVE